MGKRDKLSKKDRKFDERSDARTADFLARRLETIRDEVGDLIADAQSLRQFDDVTTLGCSVQWVERLRKKYRKRAEGYSWEEDNAYRHFV